MLAPVCFDSLHHKFYHFVENIYTYTNTHVGCWFQNDGMSLFINYIPRWTIVFVIMTIYISLFRYITKSSDFDTDDMEFHRRIRERDDTMVRGGGESFAEAPVNYQATEKDLRAVRFLPLL